MCERKEKKHVEMGWGNLICFAPWVPFMLPSHSITPFKLHMYKIHVGSIA